MKKLTIAAAVLAAVAILAPRAAWREAALQAQAFATVQAGRVAASDSQIHTVPAVASDTFTLNAATQTLTNKTLTTPVISTISNTGTVTLPTATDTLVGRATTDTLTNKTLDAEGTGNLVSVPEKLWIRAAWCQNATAGTDWDLPTTNAAAAACNTGTNTQKGTLDFADGANLISAQYSLMLPSDWTSTGGVDVRLKWFDGTATSGSVVWNASLVCVADAETSDPAFGTASAATDAAKGTVNQDNDVLFTNVSTAGGSCAAGELMYVKIARDANNGSDTMTDTARVRGIEITYRRAM